ncbi:DUF1835 domain-containing protein [Kiloniella antarctica]|uniref:DUF1835 domain-containing protein n=1 Tax=Kiloniella antarctica TaxID=1550907 RepID=A0ABW5BKY7_9PROT
MTSTPPVRPSRPQLSREYVSRTMFHGSVNFEQQKKRAKDLHKALIKGKDSAITRLKKHHPKVLDLIASPLLLKLNDCQLVIARENNFSSWPQLKAHCDRLNLRKKQISEGITPQLDEVKTLHIRCGSDIKHGLDIAGFKGDFHEFSDPFCQGPLPNLEGVAFYTQRAEFIATTYGLPFQETLTRQKQAYDKLETLTAYDKVVLWFEHDSYDQLILAYLLNHIAGLSSSLPIELICVDHVPGVPDFTGLGQLAPEMLVWLWENQRAPLSKAQISLGKTVWNALRQGTATNLETIIAKGTPEIPPMVLALSRHLQELPDAETGLSLTQQITLEILYEKGTIKSGKLFSILMREREPLPFLGDLMFWSILNELVKAKKPLITYGKIAPDTPWPERKISLTNTGRSVLKGDLNYLHLTQTKRWVGGIKII